MNIGELRELLDDIGRDDLEIKVLDEEGYVAPIDEISFNPITNTHVIVVYFGRDEE